MKEAFSIILATLKARVMLGDLTPEEAKVEAIQALAKLKTLYGVK
jgi:hypothetical protein